MSGHSHWARIKRAKAVTDSRRGKAWSKLSRGIILAARNGPDPNENLALRYAIDAARAENMPKDTIERAIKKGSGELGGAQMEELTYEGYGPGGAAIMCTAVTDNRNRTAPEIKKIFEIRHGKLGPPGSVARMFSRRGVVRVAADKATEEQLTGIALDAGADDVRLEGDVFELTCDPATFEPLRKAVEAAGLTAHSAELTMVPATTVALTGDDAERMLKLVDALEEHDDVQDVYSNFELSEADIQRLT